MNRLYSFSYPSSISRKLNKSKLLVTFGRKEEASFWLAAHLLDDLLHPCPVLQMSIDLPIIFLNIVILQNRHFLHVFISTFLLKILRCTQFKFRRKYFFHPSNNYLHCKPTYQPNMNAPQT